MTIEEAIKTAIEFETEVRDVYRDAVNRAEDPTAKRVFNVMADEEQDHIRYLGERLIEWHKTGKVEPAALKTAVPSKDAIAEGASKLASGMSDADHGTEMEMLRKALDAERRTSDFYRKMVTELPVEGQRLFERFVEIEEGHLAIVQAEMDSLTGTGAWFDVLEIKL